MRRLRPLAVVVVACALALSGVVAPLGAAVFAQPAAGQDDVPRGMVGVPNSNVHDNVPDHAVEKMPSADDFRGSVMTNRHAESLSVSVTTRGQVDSRASSCRAGRTPEWCESPELALVLSDGTNHDGRTVTVPKAPVVANLGRVPELAYITHSSGEEYEVQVTDHGDQLAFHVEEFSSNTVTFSGEVSIQGDPATEGAQYSYELQDLDSVANYSIDVTGRRNAEWRNTSATGLTDGGSLSMTLGGTTAPEGPASGSPELAVASHTQEAANWSKDGYTSSSLSENGGWIEATVDHDGWLTHFKMATKYGAATMEVTVDGTVDSQFTAETGGHWYTVPLSNPVHVADGDTVRIRVTNVDGAVSTQPYYNSSVAGESSVGTDGLAIVTLSDPSASDITVDADDGTSHTITGGQADGATTTTAFGVSKSASSLSVSGPGAHDVTLDAQAVSESTDPTVEVNGDQTGYTGTLSDGQTASLTTDPAWVQNGTNRVNVTFGAAVGPGPSPQVALDYRHDAAEQQTTTYSGETWTERYNVSRTYAESRTGTSLRIPFASDRVVAVRDLEIRTNGGDWSTIPESDRDFDGSELVAQIGDVQAGDQVEVRAAASKVRTQNGEITVLEPTVEGDVLETEVELSAWSSDAYIDVTGTHPDHNLHHTVNKSWTDPKDYALVRSGGQELHFPAASSGSTARIETLPLEVRPNNDVRVRVTSGGVEPTLEVSPGPTKGDDVEWYYKHSDLQTGETYLLWSKSDGKVVDQAEASSPISLFSSDDTQTLQILHDDDGNTTSGSGGGGFWEQGESAVREYAPVIDPEIILFVALLLLVGGVAYSERKSPETAAHKRPGVILGSVAALGVALLFLAPNAVAEPVQTALQATLPLLGLGVVGFAGLVAYGWYRKQQNESKPATIQVMGREK